jgi:hypothetical protein
MIRGYAAIIDRAAVGLPETIVVEVTQWTHIAQGKY